MYACYYYHKLDPRHTVKYRRVKQFENSAYTIFYNIMYTNWRYCEKKKNYYLKIFD